MTILRPFLTAILLMTCFSANLRAMALEEVDTYLKKATIAEQNGQYQEAIKIYMEISKSGSGWALTSLSELYAKQFKDYKKSALWCIASMELIYPYDFMCENQYDGKFSNTEIRDIHRLAIQCIATKYTACDTYNPTANKNAIDLYYSKYCIVNDPTGTELNVRSAPHGEIKMSLPNGWHLIVYEIKKDKNAKEWALIASTETAEELGWTFKNYLKCNTRERI